MNLPSATCLVPQLQSLVTRRVWPCKGSRHSCRIVRTQTPANALAFGAQLVPAVPVASRGRLAE